MLHYTVTFLLISIVAAVLGFGGLAGTAAEFAKICFLVFLALYVFSFFIGKRSA
jgi:uncharacterized membrane protein YtjA (UPF0391 family)